MTAVILGAKLWLISDFGSPTPFWDQWDAEAAWLFKPYIEGTLPIGALLAPHNEHRLLWSRLAGIVLLELNGRWDPIIEMTSNALVHVAALAVLVAMLGATLGRAERLALAVTTAILFALPFGSSNTLVGFQGQFYFLPLFSLACFHYGVDAPAFSVRWLGAVTLGVCAYFAMASGALTLVVLIAVHGLQAIVRERSGWREYVAMALSIVIMVLMLSGIPTIDYNAPLTAHSVSQFASAFFVAMAWPFSEVARMQPRPGWDLVGNLAAAVLVNIPLLAFAWSRRCLAAADRSVWIYFLVGLWTVIQAASLAYGRAVAVLDSRYLDILIINTILNVACLLSLVQANVGYPIRHAAAAWASAIAAMVTVLAAIWLPRELRERWPYTQQQAINMSAFLVTGDKAHLADKPFRTIPYGSPERLRNLASDSSIRSILPEDIMPAAEAHTQNSKLLLGGPLYHRLPHTPFAAPAQVWNWHEADMASGRGGAGYDPKREECRPAPRKIKLFAAWCRNVRGGLANRA
jgi:hypothetical protein